MAVTLAQLKERARVRADMEDSEFVQDPELTEYINSGIAELHDILIQAYGEDYYVKSSDFSTVSGQNQYNLTTVVDDEDFYKLRGLDAKLNNSDWFTLTRFNFNERNRFENFGAWTTLGLIEVRYRLVGANIMFTPTPDANINMRLWYIPRAQVLVDDADEFDDINYYSEYVVTCAAIKMMNKEETDSRMLIIEKKDLKKRIEEASSNRDAENCDSVQDVYAESNPYFYGRF